jgi:hypothetical protein
MSTLVFSARLTAGQETTFFGYSRGLNGKRVVNAVDARETNKTVNTNMETMTQW